MTRHAAEPSHLSEDEILALVHGLAGSEERAQRLAHVANCDACAEVLRRRVAERERGRIAFARRAGAREERARAPSAEGRDRVMPAEGVGRRPGIGERWVAGTIAAVALAIAVMIGVHTASRRAMAEVARRHAGALPSQPEWLVLRQDARSADTTARAGIRAYARGDMDAAITLLQRVSSSDPSAPLANLYLGNLQVRRGQFTRAAERLAALPADLPEPWAEERRWLDLMTALGSGRAARADSLLNAIESGPPNWWERAKSVRRAWRGAAR